MVVNPCLFLCAGALYHSMFPLRTIHRACRNWSVAHNHVHLYLLRHFKMPLLIDVFLFLGYKPHVHSGFLYFEGKFGQHISDKPHFCSKYPSHGFFHSRNWDYQAISGPSLPVLVRFHGSSDGEFRGAKRKAPGSPAALSHVWAWDPTSKSFRPPAAAVNGFGEKKNRFNLVTGLNIVT